VVGWKHQEMECNGCDDNEQLISMEHNEKIQKVCQSHRDANCVEGEFVERALRECIGV